MLTPTLRWVLPDSPYRLAVTPCPAGLDQLPRHIETWRRANIGCVVSLWEPHESEHSGVEREQTCCKEAGLRFISFPIPDHGLPGSHTDFSALIDAVTDEVAWRDLGRRSPFGQLARRHTGVAGIASPDSVPVRSRVRRHHMYADRCCADGVPHEHMNMPTLQYDGPNALSESRFIRRGRCLERQATWDS